MDPSISMVCLIPTAVFLWPIWHPGWKDTRSIPSLGVHRPQLLPPPVIRLHRHIQRILFFEEGHLWTRGQMQELLRLLLSSSPLPLVQPVQRRSHELECFLSLDKQTSGGKIQCVTFSHTGHIMRPFWILPYGGRYAIGKDKHLSRLSGVTEVIWFS